MPYCRPQRSGHIWRVEPTAIPYRNRNLKSGRLRLIEGLLEFCFWLYAHKLLHQLPRLENHDRGNAGNIVGHRYAVVVVNIDLTNSACAGIFSG